MSDDDEEGPRPRARNTDPHTSHEAADSVKHIRYSQAVILRIVRLHGPITDVGIWEWLAHYSGKGLIKKRISPSGARTRRCELGAQGLVFDTGSTTKLPSGRQAILWEAVPVGEPSGEK